MRIKEENVDELIKIVDSKLAQAKRLGYAEPELIYGENEDKNDN